MSDSRESTADAKRFRRRLLRWFDRHGRRSLPWQGSRDPYHVWVAEIMLQQTQVRTVIPYYQKFTARFPNIASLASCGEDELLHYWSGLGYYARARNMRLAAQKIVAQHHGKFPGDFAQVMALPGIGRSTAGAICAFAHGMRRPILDGNVKRVLSRHYIVSGDHNAQTTLWQIAERLTPAARVADYTQAIMDLGATVCTRASPQCNRCPLRPSCRAFADGNPAAYPRRKKTPVRRHKTVTMLLIQNRHGELLLIKRPPSGIWGGLWSPPEYTAAPIPEQWCEQQFGLSVKTGEPLPTVKHSFTHFDLDIHPLPARLQTGNPVGQVMETAAHLWYNPNKPAQIGIPAPVGRMLKMFRNQK